MPAALVINPNTSESMTEAIRATASKIFLPPWEFHVARAKAGPESLESWRDYQLAGVTVLPLLHEYSQVDGIVLACFGDPGLYALKEISPVPVVGIAEAAMAIATLVGGSFGIIAGMGRAVHLMNSMVRTYGMEVRYAGTVALDMRVLNFEENRPETLQNLETAGRELIRRGADTILLGCAGLTSFIDDITQRLPVSVIDPVEAGCRMLKVIVESRLNTSHGGIFTRPAPQRMHHLEDLFTPYFTKMLREWETGNDE